MNQIHSSHPSSRAAVVLAVFFALASCATFPVAPAFDPGIWAVASSSPDPQVDALAERFYGGAFDPPALAAEVEAALAKNQRSGTLHEMAGYLARLNADPGQAWHQLTLAAFDASNPFAAHDLWEAHQGELALSERVSDLDGLKVLEKQHPDADVRALATWLRASELRLLGSFAEADAEIASLRFVGRWKVIGAFDNEEGRGFSAVQPPEKAIDLAAPVPGVVVPVSWRSVDAVDVDGRVPLESLVSPASSAVAYLVTWIQVAQDREAVLRVTTPAPLIAWVNDLEVSREERMRGGGFDGVVVPIALRAGWNKLLIKSAVKTGSWTLAARLTDPDGGALDCKVSPEPQKTPEGKSVAAAKPKPLEGARAELWQMRELVRRGAVHEGAEKLSAAATRMPDNPLVRLFAAEVLREDSQVEHALDLLTRGVEGAQHPAPELLLSRASIYREKSLHDQAEADLKKATELSPDSRDAQLDAAALLGARGWQEERRAVLEKAFARWPSSMQARLELAECLAAQRHTTQAEAAYADILALEPGAQLVLRKLRDLAEDRQDFKAALRYAELLRKRAPFSIPDAMARAELFRRNDDPKAAAAELTAISKQDPDYAGPFRRRAVLAEEAGDRPGALALWEMAAERDPNDSTVSERLDHLKPHEPDVAHKYVPDDAAVAAAVKSAAGLEHLPGSQVAVLIDSEAVQLNSDGSSKRYVVGVTTAFTQNGRDQLIQAHLPHGRNKVLAAYAVGPDGSRQEASSITRAMVRFRKLEVGSTVVLRYVNYAPKVDALPGEFFTQVALSSYSGQVESGTFTLVSPRGRAITVDAGALVKRTDSQDGEFDVRRFEVSHLPAETYEASMTPPSDYLQKVSVSTLPDWDKFVAWEKAILLDSFRPDPQIHALALKLTGDAKSPQAKVDRLYQYVAQEIRYQQEYETILAGWQPHPATVVLERKYGDCKDKATLFISLLREVGIDGEFVVLPTHHVGHLPKGVVLPYFDHAIAYLPEQPGIAPQFIDNTVDALDIGNLRADDQGASALLLDPKAGSFRWQDIPYQPPPFQHDDFHMTIDISSPAAAKATSDISLRGSYASSIRKALRNDVQAQKFYAALVSFIFPRSTLVRAGAADAESIDHPLVIHAEADLSGSISAEGDHFRLNLPSRFPLAGTVSLAQRKTKLDLGAPGSSSAEIEATIDPSLRLKAPPAPVSVKSTCFEVTRTVALEGSKLKISDRFQRTCAEIAVDAYPAFRADVEKASGALDQAIVFEVAPRDAKTSRKSN